MKFPKISLCDANLSKTKNYHQKLTKQPNSLPKIPLNVLPAVRYFYLFTTSLTGLRNTVCSSCWPPAALTTNNKRNLSSTPIGEHRASVIQWGVSEIFGLFLLLFV